MKCSFLPLCALWLVTSGPTAAIVDTNENTVSDLWEKQYNNGELYPSTFDAGADPDQDGWTNTEEAAAGTDPKNPNPPDGLVQPEILHTPAVSGEENGQPVIITPEAVTVSWPTLVGKQYTLLFSSDLAEESWLTIDQPFIGDGDIHEFNFLIAGAADKRFWRVGVQDTDTDGDTLTNAEEHALGTNPNSTDTDGDGKTDDEEVEDGSEPNDPDSDNDTLNDGVDADPLDEVINWSAGPHPAFAVIELDGEALADADQLQCDDLTEEGTILLSRIVNGGVAERIVVNRNQVPIPYQSGSSATGESYVGYGTQLIGEMVPGFRFVNQSSQESLWEPLADTYTDWGWSGVISGYHDDIKDNRNGFTIFHGTNWPDNNESTGLRITPSGDLLPGAAAVENSQAKIERNRNIITQNAYWRWDTDTSAYDDPVPLPELVYVPASATLRRPGPQPGQILEWNLAATSSGLAVAVDDGAFQMATESAERSQLNGVSKQGWISRLTANPSSSSIWANGEWKELQTSLGDPAITSARMLKLLDTGLGVARIRKGEQPSAIALLLPVEVDQEGCTPEKGIRFCRWLDSFNGDSLKPDCGDKDRDRFRRCIPAVLPNLTRIHIKSFGLAAAVIDGLWTAKNTDGGYDVTMTEENGTMVSKWMLLVSDGDDDKYYNGIGTDNGPNDQTLLADFNSPIEVTLPEYQNAKVTFHAQQPLGDLEIQPYFLSPAGDVPPDMTIIIKNRLEKMKEIYRQIGVRVGYYGIEGKAVPQSWFDAVTVPPIQPADHLTKSETVDARIALSQTAVPEKRIRVGFVDATLMVGYGFGEPVLGVAPLGSDPAIISLDQDRSDARRILAVTAHEVGHSLGLDHLEQVEPVQYNPVPKRWLMRDGGDNRSSWENKPTDTKRFQPGDFDIIRNSTFYAPN